MGTEILKSFGSLQSELEEAKNTLKGVDENIKRLIGRDPSEIVNRATVKRSVSDDLRSNRLRLPQGNRSRTFSHENDEPPAKRRSATSVFKRLSERPTHYEEESVHNSQGTKMISKVIVTPKEVPSRQEALAAQNSDEKFKARNRRMFGALLGTLQKFQQEETKLKPREDKRAQLEKKIEEHEIREKAEIKKERQELFLNRKKKQAEIKMIELKMLRMKEYATWEERQKPRMNYLMTKAKPHIHYLPRKLNESNKSALEECKKDIEKMIEKRRQAVFDELKIIEERMKRNFKNKDDTNDDNHEANDDHHEVNEDNRGVNAVQYETNAGHQEVNVGHKETNEDSCEAQMNADASLNINSSSVNLGENISKENGSVYLESNLPDSVPNLQEAQCGQVGTGNLVIENEDLDNQNADKSEMDCSDLLDERQQATNLIEIPPDMSLTSDEINMSTFFNNIASNLASNKEDGEEEENL